MVAGNGEDWAFAEGLLSRDRWLTAREYKLSRILTDQDWIDLRAEYVSGLDGLIERAKVIAAKIRGEPTAYAEAPAPDIAG